MINSIKLNSHYICFDPNHLDYIPEAETQLKLHSPVIFKLRLRLHLLKRTHCSTGVPTLVWLTFELLVHWEWHSSCLCI